MMAAGEEPHDEELRKRADNSDTEKAALAVDYLVVGAGLASLAFLDELLSLDSKATFALVDKNEAPGGHWNFAYPFVRLHQPAAYYGVSSEPLAAGAKRSCMMTFEPYDNKDLADKEKLLAYFARAVRRFEATGRVQYFARATFSDGIIACADGSKRSVNVVRKLVLPASNVVVPAMRPPAYAVAEGVDCGRATSSLARARRELTPCFCCCGAGCLRRPSRGWSRRTAGTFCGTTFSTAAAPSWG